MLCLSWEESSSGDMPAAGPWRSIRQGSVSEVAVTACPDHRLLVRHRPMRHRPACRPNRDQRRWPHGVRRRWRLGRAGRGAQNRATLRIDEIDSSKIPTRVTHGHAAEVTQSRRNLKSHSGERNRPIALTLNARCLKAKGFAKRLARWAFTQHVGRLC